MGDNGTASGQLISLPKGGGALQGIGETFSPDLHTGTGNFSIPIAVPPGRNGFQPQLSLVYSTGNGNGPFGLGWDLNVPGVSRKTSKGIPRYLDKEDIFLISGSEDLVPIGAAGGPARYRPRTEGIFARLEHDDRPGTNHWQVRSHDGLVSFYGTPDRRDDDPAVIADPGDRNKIFEWKMSATEDSFGNSILYEYERDTGDTSEHHWDQLYLKRIRYADYLDSQATKQFLASVTFQFEERPDPFSQYRSGFEIRTRKRCTRIEIRTHADRDRLVRSYQLIYLDQRGLRPERLPLNAVSLLSQVVVEGHDEEKSERLPALEFGYTQFQPAHRRYQPLSAESNSLPPHSLGNAEYDLVDLFGNGLPDVIQTNEPVRYWRNLGNGRFDMPRPMAAVPPLVHLSDPGVQLIDANGNGRADLMVLNGSQSGYYPLTFDGAWNRSGFVRYRSAPSISLEAPDVRLFDLDGDGVTDALRTGIDFELYYNDPEEGWSAVEVRKRVASDSFPDVQFSDARVKLADLTGDGLQDIVLIHDGRVEYWPYLGYGRWSRRVTMRNSPRFEDASFYPGAGYDPNRLLVGDVDGDGAADLVYVCSGHITLWINQGGNAWSDPITINGTPQVTDSSVVRLADMLGQGTEGILWTYDFATFRDSTYKFLDLTGGLKPYLLDQMDNHLGALTRVSYAPSTSFYLRDQKQPETRWRTSLPFPTQVITRVEVVDQISLGKLTTEYRYHHGYWDGVEREFRGFGMVEQLDTEIFSDYHKSSATNFEPVAEEHFSPPTLTKTWFHQGPILEEDGDWRELDWSSEYWPGDPSALAHTESVNSFLQTLPEPRVKRDALRSLRGSILRTELFALDGSARQARPYTVTEHAYGLREEAPPAAGESKRTRIFFPHRLKQRTTQWERGDEPMTQFAFTDEYDAYGNPGSLVSLAVPRGRDFRLAAATSEPYLGVQTLTKYAQRDDVEHYLAGRVAGGTAYEIINNGRQPIDELYRAIRSGSVERKLVSQSFSYYDGPAFVGMPFGELGDHGALTRSETLVLTEEILREVHGGDPNIPPYLRPGGPPTWPGEYPIEFHNQIKPLAGYTFADGSDHRARGYFAQSARKAFDFQLAASPSPRGLLVGVRDPLGNDSRMGYDDFRLLPVSLTNAVGLSALAENDYRVMQPRAVVDANGNRSRCAFTPLGLVNDLFVMGKADANEGDSELPSMRFEYDPLAFENRRQPVSVRSLSREHHDTEPGVDASERDATVEAVTYSDGFGRILQTRTQAEALIFEESVLPLDQNDLAGTRRAVLGRRPVPGADLNVVVSGWQIYDNKGRVVEKYEPFFSTGWAFTPRSDSQRGQRVRMFYDPRGQVIRTVNPDGSEQRVIYGIPENLTNPEVFRPTPWEAYTYDANDNAGRTHAQESSSYQHHWNTPSNVVVDALGRTITATQRNRSSNADQIEQHDTRSTYDIRGNLLTVKDPLDRTAFKYFYDLANEPLQVESIDAGTRQTVLDAGGKELERRDSKGALQLQAHDGLNRTIRLWARDGAAGAVTLRQVLEYGDGSDPDQDAAQREEHRQKNRLGQLYRLYDEAGRATADRYDFKGNLLEKTREIISDAELLSALSSAQPAYVVDWQPAGTQSREELASLLLDSTTYQTENSYDALNRIRTLRYPQDRDGQRKALRLHYNNGGALERVELNSQVYVAYIAYNAKGQRLFIAMGNGVITRYAYDAQTFRLRRLRSESYTTANPASFQPSGTVLQDFAYDYDLGGNILRIIDRALGCGVKNNPEAGLESDPALRALIVSGDALPRRFEYDAIYRLVSASGRESRNLSRPTPWHDDSERSGFNETNHGTPNQANAPDLTNLYREAYSYDPAGNLLRLNHMTSVSSFVRQFSLVPGNNRLRSLTVGATEFAYTYDANGNMTDETASRQFSWNHNDQSKAFRVQAGASEPSLQALYLYDAAGMRVKKLIRRQGGQLESAVYIGDIFEHHRWQSSSGSGQNNFLQVMDDRQRVALLRVGQAHPQDRGPSVQYTLADHLGSSGVVVDQQGGFINREEYTPYGESAFGGFGKKRYRFTGMERDEESGLNYHGARYYAPWLARWNSSDPLGAADGLNLYSYVRNRPLGLIDPAGTDGETTDIYHRTTERGALGMERGGARVDMSKAHAWGGKGFYGSSDPNIPGYGGYDQQGKNTIVRQTISTENMATLSAEDAAWLQEGLESKELRSSLWTKLGLEKRTNQPSNLRDLISQYLKKSFPGKNVVRWQVAGSESAYNYVVLSETALVDKPIRVGAITKAGEFSPLETALTSVTRNPQAGFISSKLLGSFANGVVEGGARSILTKVGGRALAVAPWWSVVTADNEGDAVFGVAAIQACKLFPEPCAVVAGAALSIPAGLAVGEGYAQGIEDRHPGIAKPGQYYEYPVNPGMGKR
jgi:RHS repeat-associated protein